MFGIAAVEACTSSTQILGVERDNLDLKKGRALNAVLSSTDAQRPASA